MPVIPWTYSATGLGLTILDVIWCSEWLLFQSNAAIRSEIWDLQLGPELWVFEIYLTQKLELEDEAVETALFE